jgi:hypothetical protein
MRFSSLRVGIILILFPLLLGLINQLSLFIAPCNYSADTIREDYKKNNPSNYECSAKDGIIFEGIALFAKIPPEGWTAIFSGLIALFTLTLWISTDRLWRTSREHARHLERSVKVATRGALATEKAAKAAEDAANAASVVFLKCSYKPRGIEVMFGGPVGGSDHGSSKD